VEDILFDILRTTMIDIDANLDRLIKFLTGAEKRIRTAIHAHILFHAERQKEVIIYDSEPRGLTVDNYETIIKMRDKYDHKFQSIIKRGIDEGIFAETDHKILSYAIII
jgi:hypothetical protein